MPIDSSFRSYAPGPLNSACNLIFTTSYWSLTYLWFERWNILPGDTSPEEVIRSFDTLDYMSYLAIHLFSCDNHECEGMSAQNVLHLQLYVNLAWPS